MKKIKYRLTSGKTIEIEYDEKAPCWSCGKPVENASMGGTVICPWCDCGQNRDGSPITPEQERDGKNRFRRFKYHPDLKGKSYNDYGRREFKVKRRASLVFNIRNKIGLDKVS